MKAKNMTKRLFAGLLAAAMVFTSAPMTQAEAAKKKAVTITVTTQAELNAALAKKGVTSIVIKTKDNVTLKLTNVASKAKLVVDAPNARISNSAKLAGITIKDAKAFTEKSVKGNSITVADKKLSLTVAQVAQNVTVRSSAKNADINLKVNGELKKLTVDKKAGISIKGSTDQTVTIVNNAKGSAVDVNVESAKMALTQPADVKIAEGTNIAKLMVKTDANIEVAKGASVDKVVVAGKDASVAIQADGAVGKVDVNSKAEVALTGSTDQKVELNVNAKDAAVSTAVKTEVNVNADAEVSIEKGAEGSSVAKADGVETKVSNASDDKISITDSKGNESSVDAGKTAISNDEGTKEETKEPEKKPETPVISGGDSGSSSSESKHVSLKGIAADEETKSVEVGKSIKLVPVFTPADATNRMIYWSVSDGSVASVDDNGNVEAKKVGQCTVTATSDQGGFKAIWTINVTAATLTGITLSQKALSLYTGDTVTLTATAVPAAASIEGAVWESNNTEIATVNNGVVTATSTTGTAIITCKTGEVSATCTVTVKAVPSDVTMVTLTFQDDSSKILSTKKVVSGAALENVQPAAPSKEGYNFDGWSIGENDTVITDILYTGTEITLKANFTPITYKISFPDEKIPDISATYDKSVTMPAGYDRVGYDFLGWATSANASSAEVASGGSIQCKGNAQYYGVWKWKDIKVTATAIGAKYNYGFWKKEDGDNLFGATVPDDLFTNEMYWTRNLTGYLPYDGKLSAKVSFKAEAGKAISGITIDEKALDEDALKIAIQNGYVSVDRKKDHTIDITTTDATIEFKAKDGAYQEISTIKIDGYDYTQYTYIVTASSIKISDVFTVTTTGITSPKIAYKYNINGQAYDNLDQVVTPQKHPSGISVWISGDNYKETLTLVQVQVKTKRVNIILSPIKPASFGLNGDTVVCTASAVTLGDVVTASAIEGCTFEFYKGTGQAADLSQKIIYGTDQFNAGTETIIWIIANEQVGDQAYQVGFRRFTLVVKQPETSGGNT